MPRHDPSEKTKMEILTTAVRLFSEKGWENVNVEDVVKEVGVTRGAFYHYFKSREELVYAVMVQMFLDSNPYTVALRQEGLNAHEKLRFAFNLNQEMQTNPTLIKDLKKAFESPVIFKSNLLMSVNEGSKFLEAIIEEGNKDGSMAVVHPKQTAQIMFVLFNAWLDIDIFKVSYDEYVEKVEFLIYFCNLLGLPDILGDFKEHFLKMYETYK
ncbi:MAG: TetR/AcrR family transcriptional regulator [Defluviitaleaceae bacterium]|nr:TetR/AcrR family transcriptional regulator [Defluviitaleaceae bacterium]